MTPPKMLQAKNPATGEHTGSVSAANLLAAVVTASGAVWNIAEVVVAILGEAGVGDGVMIGWLNSMIVLSVAASIGAGIYAGRAASAFERVTDALVARIRGIGPE